MVLSILSCLDRLRLWQHPASNFLAYFSVLADAFRTSSAASGDPVLGSEGTPLILVGVVFGCDSLRGSRLVQSHVLLSDMPVVSELLKVQHFAFVVLDVLLDFA